MAGGKVTRTWRRRRLRDRWRAERQERREVRRQRRWKAKRRGGTFTVTTPHGLIVYYGPSPERSRLRELVDWHGPIPPWPGFSDDVRPQP